MIRILLAGGGTAGHTSPLLATADALKRLDNLCQVVCVGTARGLETRVVPAAGYELELIPPVPLPRRLNRDLVAVPNRLRRAIAEAGAVIDRVQPHVVVGFGGYVSLPVYFAARRRRLPIVVHEQNALPGIANKIGARFATRVAVSFPDTPLPGAVLIGLPLRRMISQLDRAASRREACDFFGLKTDQPTLLVTGGSQGAAKINSAVSGAAATLADAGIQVLHVVGPNGEIPAMGDQIIAESRARRVVHRFLDRMDLAYAAADLVVCRAGASSVSEAASLGLPAIFVPLPIGNGEQRLNARPVVEAGGALTIENAELSAEWLSRIVPELMADPVRLQAMGLAASRIIPRGPDDAFARLITEVATREPRRWSE